MELKRRHSLLLNALDALVIFLAFGLVNVNSFIRFRQFSEVENFSTNELDYILFGVTTVILIGFLLWKRQLFPIYSGAWKNNKLLIVFLAYALVSVLWTIYLPATLNKLFFFFFSTIVGSYIAVRYGRRGSIDVLTWIGAICSVLSILIVQFFPFVGVMQNEPFVGSWTGMFWHRNHTGNIFAFFNMIFLFRFLLDDQSKWINKVVFAFFYILSALMVFGSRSATGTIVFLFIQFVVGLIVIWLKFHQRIKRWHYYGSVALLLTGFLVFITNTDFFFGLLGRSSNLTGRVPLWLDLFQNYYMQKPLFGFGFGALWMLKSFRILIQIRHSWPYQVYFADNGFFDILLNMGMVGLLIFMFIYLSYGVRSFRQAIRNKSWLYFFPFLAFLYILIGNLTYSFLLEVDQFVWMILIMMIFITTDIQDAS
jgi:exopolysaccharide production protein ExoQ